MPPWQAPPQQWAGETPESLLTRDELRQCLEMTLEDLSPLQRAVLTLREMEGLEMDEICTVLEITPANARVLLHRARNKIWAAVERYQSGQRCRER